MGAVATVASVTALFLLMSFSYQFGVNPPIDIPRLLVSDTVDNPPTAPCVFQDQEILAFENIVVPGVWQSSMFFTPPTGTATLPSQPINYLRVAAYMLNSMAGNQAKLSAVIQLLDVKLDPSKAAVALRSQAQEWMDIDDNSGAFVIVEQVNNYWSFRDRFWAQWQRVASG